MNVGSDYASQRQRHKRRDYYVLIWLLTGLSIPAVLFLGLSLAVGLFATVVEAPELSLIGMFSVCALSALIHLAKKGK